MRTRLRTNIFAALLCFSMELLLPGCGRVTVERPVVRGLSNANQRFTHTGLTSTCVACHEVDRPASIVAGQAHGNGADCVQCHQSSAWLGGATFSHTPTPTSCVSCHDVNRPAVTAAVPSSGTKNLFVHSTLFNGTADCVSCHTAVPANAGVRWSGGVYNHKDSTGANVGTCTSCHGIERPSGAVGSPSFNHASGGSGDCASCHTNPGVTWAGASFSHSPTPASCISCHSAAIPAAAALVPSGSQSPYAHLSQFNGTADCVSCHTVVPANVGVSWAGAKFNHKTPANANVTTCLTCHVSRGKNQHGNNVGDCASCHGTGHNFTSWAN